MLRPHRCRTHRRPPGDLVHRPDRPAGRRARAAAHRLARSRGPPLLRRHPQGPERADPPPPHLHQEPHGHRGRRRGLRPGPAVRAGPPEPVRRGHADRQHHQPPYRPDERRGGHHPGRAGPGHPFGAAGRAGRAGRPGHRQDRRGAAPGRVPALHPPAHARAPRRARHRAERHLPPLHQPGPAVPRRDRRGAQLDRRALPRRQGRPRRQSGSRRGQGRRHDGERAPPRSAQPAAGAARRPGDHRGRRGHDRAEPGRAARPRPGPRPAQAAQRGPQAVHHRTARRARAPPRRGRSAATWTPRTSPTRGPGCGTSRRSGPRSTRCGPS